MHSQFRSSPDDPVARIHSGAGAAWTDGSQITAAEWNPNYDAALSDGVTNPAEDQYARGGTVKMTREGDIFTLWYVWDNEDWYQNEFELAMTDPVYVGVAVTSHTTGATSQGLFANPQFDGRRRRRQTMDAVLIEKSDCRQFE